MMRLILFLLLIHLTLCAAIAVFSAFSLLKIHFAAFSLFFVPIFGPACLLALDLGKRLHRSGSTRVSEGKLQVQSEILRSIPTPDGCDADIVPLEEAMLLNRSGIRRNLMLELLQGDPEEFYDLLEQARLNDDVEVVHYATTAMSELNKKYDLLLQKCTEACREAPEDRAALEALCDCLKIHLSLGLARGQVALLRRQEYIRALTKLEQLEETREILSRLAHQQLIAADPDAAEETVARMAERFPDAEETWMLRLACHVCRRDGRALQALLRSAQESSVYFRREAASQLAFWGER